MYRSTIYGLNIGIHKTISKLLRNETERQRVINFFRPAEEKKPFFLSCNCHPKRVSRVPLSLSTSFYEFEKTHALLFPVTNGRLGAKVTITTTIYNKPFIVSFLMATLPNFCTLMMRDS